jgi:hypothetical protein
LSTNDRVIYGFERTIQRRDVSGLSVAYCASRIVPIPRGGKISISGHRVVQTVLEAKERERARATTYLHSVAEAEIPTLSNGAREKIEKKYHWQAAHLTDSGRAHSGRNYYLG